MERLQQALIEGLPTIKKHAVSKLSKAIVQQFTQNALLQQDNTKIRNSNKISKPRRKGDQAKFKAQLQARFLAIEVLHELEAAQEKQQRSGELAERKVERQ